MKLYSLLETLLKSDSNNLVITDNQGDLMLNKIHDLVDKTDENLIRLLLENQVIREKFFIKIKDVYVFKTSDFKFFLDENKIDNSYTQYENRIGLTTGGKFLKDSSDVVLDFPYKDCVLEGGQSTEEGTDTYFEYDANDHHYQEKQAKRKEIFFNFILAKDEIDRLLEPKAFSNIKKHTVNGEENITSFERDANGTIKDNLIIKGNNLLALHSLKSEFAGKVKLIYIDPPYNTGNDSFAYNDNFNHSTWLTFMRNRLLVAKELLREDGVIFVHLDYNEIHYCKLLMDEIFGRNRFINEIIWRRKQATSYGKGKFGITNDTILFYSKNMTYDFHPIYSISDDNTQKYIKERFIFDDGDGRKYMKSPLVNSLYRPNLKYIFEGINPPDNGWLYSKEKMQQFFDNGELIIPKDENSRIYRRIFLDTYKGQVVQNLWTDISIVNPMAKEQVDFGTQKPEKLLERILKSVTVEGDIVLDFQLGSGTTSAVAHKMKRQYIGIEQMNYLENITIDRMNKVVNGDESGISKDEDIQWQGGGSFIYLELAKNNQNAIEYIQTCESYEALVSFFDEMCDKYFLHYNVKIKEFREVICKEENFKKLTLEQQKVMFAKMLDLNQLYVNVSDMKDSRFDLSENDIVITKKFYQI